MDVTGVCGDEARRLSIGDLPHTRNHRGPTIHARDCGFDLIPQTVCGSPKATELGGIDESLAQLCGKMSPIARLDTKDRLEPTGLVTAGLMLGVQHVVGQ